VDTSELNRGPGPARLVDSDGPRVSVIGARDLIVVVDKGKAAEIGSHEGLLAQDGAYASLVAHQLLKQREQLDQDTQAGTSGAASGAAPSGGRGRGGGRG
jgi:hypothetical protein